MTAPAAPADARSLPCAVQIGFSGARRLFDRTGLDPATIKRIESDIDDALVRELAGVRAALGLGPQHFLCGLSQIAIGSDLYFTRACSRASSDVLLQRIYLPQPLDAYLDAHGSKSPDFLPDEKETARALLNSPHIAHVQCMSSSDDRHERLQEASQAILEECDLAVCLVRPNPEIKPGGAGEFASWASQSGKPLLQIEVTVQDLAPKVTATWYRRENFRAPALPSTLESVPCRGGTTPDSASCGAALQTHFNEQARKHRRYFETAARIIVCAHIGATLCATVALALSAAPGLTGALAGLLVVELVLLAWGYATHHRLHHNKLTARWAADRFGAEINRSVLALRDTHLHLAHIFRTKLAAEPGWKHLFTTINVLHLHSTRSLKPGDPRVQAVSYIEERLERPGCGQIDYYRRNFLRAKRALGWLNRSFAGCVGLAAGATAAKLLKIAGLLSLPDWLGGGLGTLAVVFPVLAVGVLSWRAALDYEARATTYREMLDFLLRQRGLLAEVTTVRELRKLVLETEHGLLAETAEWYARRVVTGVT